MRGTYRSYTQILSINIRSKDVFHRRPLLTANDFIFDSTGKGKPLCIPKWVLKGTKLPSNIPLYFGHRNKRLVLGDVTNIEYDVTMKSLVGDIEVSRRWQSFVMDKIREGVNGISLEFVERHDNAVFHNKEYDKILALELRCACIVEKPASHPALI